MSMVLGTKTEVVTFMYHNSPPEGVVYHVSIPKDRKYINVICIGMECVDNTLKGCYHCLNDLPSWVQGKIAILTLCEDGQDVRKVGKRINDMTFWIYG